jgi:glucosamine--fructose-6-phosphate aminotransferase (isomerizing)
MAVAPECDSRSGARSAELYEACITRFLKKQGATTLALVNQPESTMAREADAVLTTLAGPEIGVASTKATQLAVLACLTLALGRARGTIDQASEARLSKALTEVPSRVTEMLRQAPNIAQLANVIAEARDVLYLGRGLAYPLALEGALKLKEISYIHAEGYAAGEMKHGPIALIDERVPVIMLAPKDELFEKTASNVQEVAARGGKVVMVSDRDGLKRMDGRLSFGIEVPACDPFVVPLLYAVPVQLLAYHTAVAKGTDVDQPRNLAKSVTAMLLWTLDKAMSLPVAAVRPSSTVMLVIWWTTFMHAFYLAFRVEHARKKARPAPD